MKGQPYSDSNEWERAKARDTARSEARFAYLNRRTDPQTSKDAAANVPAFKNDHETRILSAIRHSGEGGATYHEIAAITGMEPVAVGRRLAGMERRGLIIRSPDNVLMAGMTAFRDGMAVWWAA